MARRGLNSIWLPLIVAQNGFASGIHGTYQSIRRHGFQVCRGSKGVPLILWKVAEPKTVTPTTMATCSAPAAV